MLLALNVVRPNERAPISKAQSSIKAPSIKASSPKKVELDNEIYDFIGDTFSEYEYERLHEMVEKKKRKKRVRVILN